MSNIDSDLIRGNIDTIILKTMVDGDKYGLDIIKEVETRSNGTYELKQPTLYSCLKRLENQELISSYWLDSDIGGKRHYYKLTEKGKETLQKKQEEWSKSKFIIDNLLSNFNYDEYRLVKKQDYDKIIEGKQFEYTSSPVQNAPADSQNLQNSDFETTQSVTEENYSNSPIEEAFETMQDETNESEISKLSAENAQNENNNTNDVTLQEKIETQIVNENSQEVNQNQETTQNQSETKQPNFKLFEYQDAIQQNILDMDIESKSNQIDKEIEEFSEITSKLSNFGNETIETNEPQLKNEESAESFQPVLHAKKIAEEITHLETAPEIHTNQEEISEPEQIIVQDNANLQETNATETKEESFCLPSQKYEEPEPENQYETFEDDDFLQELDELNSSNSSAYFSSFDEVTYNETVINKKQSDYDFAPPQSSESKSEKTESVTIENETQISEQSDEFSQEAESTSFDYNNFDSIISESASNYIEENTSYMQTDYESFRPSYTNENYKQKLSNLSAYSKISEEESAQIFEKTKDINALKEEFEKEGIAIKKYNKTFGETSAKNYLLINKLNLVKSLILLAGYVFVLSALYIILNNTSAREMYNFSIKYFLYGFIPFIIYALIYLVIYIANPYKKIPAKYSPRIMLFISVMVTVQLLLITYCVNLQLGFYSFTQTYYNHLFWIIPLVISFAPLVSNILHISLFYSKNFNV